MDDTRFDLIVKRFGNRLSRRNLLGGAALGAALPGILGLHDAAAKKKPLKCKAPKKKCGKKCVDIKTDRNNCGACGGKCDRGEGCRDGFCNIYRVCPAGADHCGPNPYTEVCNGSLGCACKQTTEGATVCAKGQGLVVPCTSSADCPGGVCAIQTGATCSGGMGYRYCVRPCPA